MVGALPDAVRIYRRGSISEGLHHTLMVAALEPAKVGNARPWSSYERYETSPTTSHHRVLEFVVCSATLSKPGGSIPADFVEQLPIVKLAKAAGDSVD